MTITQAIISAGGFGTRLRPFTDHMPKPMIPILGKPMLEWHVEQFRRHGVTDIFVTLHHLPEVVKNHFGDGSKFGVRMHYIVEPSPLGSAGALGELASEIRDLAYYIYGDTFSLMDYTSMAAAYRAKENAVGMQRVLRTDLYADADVAELDSEGRMVAVRQKPHVQTYPNAYRMRGSFIIHRSLLDYIPRGMPFDLAKDLLPLAIGDGKRIYGYECDEYSKGIDTEAKWSEVEEYLRSRGFSGPLH